MLQVLTIMNRGGAETMIMNYYRNIDRSKVQFDFLLHRKESGVFDEEIERLGGKIHRLSNISFTNLSSYRKSLDDFFKKNPEYQIVHSHLNGLSAFVLKAAKKNNVSVRIAHSHTSQYNLNINPFSKNRDSLAFTISFLAQNIFKIGITKQANHYFACGFKAGKWLFGKKNVGNFKIINNAIEAHEFSFNQEKSIRMKRSLGIENKLVIGHVGNFVSEKNHGFLVNVFFELKKIKEDCILLLVGGGDTKSIETLVSRAGCENSVFFMGVRSDVVDLLQSMDLFLFPSTNEGLPVTLIEAQAAGLKIIASDEISNELDITGLVEFVSLKQTPKHWAKLIINSKDYIKENTRDKIVSGNYDIKNNAFMLQEFYCNQ